MTYNASEDTHTVPTEVLQKFLREHPGDPIVTDELSRRGASFPDGENLTRAICMIPNCNRTTPPREPFCSKHRD